jgi:hypothetical protein
MAERFELESHKAYEVITLYNNGFSASRIIDIKKLECTSVTLIAWLRRNNVIIRDRNKGSAGICTRCNVSFIKTQNAQKYCSGCGEKYKDRANILKHGLSDEQYAFLLERSGNACELCGYVPGPNATKSLSIDHDHNTGLTRGLLCYDCNIRMAFMDDSEWLSKAFRYQTAEHIEPMFIGRGHPAHDGTDYKRNPNYEEVIKTHGKKEA